jgi:hypothetical protein
VGSATATGAAVSAPVTASGPAGQYTLRYTVIADDGDRVDGAVRFTLTAAAAGTAAPATVAEATPEAAAVAASTATAAPTVAATPGEAAGSSGNSGWVAVAVVVIGLVAAVVLARSRRGSGRDVR